MSVPAAEKKSNVEKEARQAFIQIGPEEFFEEMFDLRFLTKKQAFMALLKEKILPHVKKIRPESISCFISYAWAKKDHPNYEIQRYHEYWTEQLALVLKEADISVFFDRWEDRLGKQINYFIEKMEESHFILLIGTKFYLEKYKRRAIDKKDREAVVRFEASLIQNTISFNTEQSERVIPILLEGKPKESFPPLGV